MEEKDACLSSRTREMDSNPTLLSHSLHASFRLSDGSLIYNMGDMLATLWICHLSSLGFMPSTHQVLTSQNYLNNWSFEVRNTPKYTHDTVSLRGGAYLCTPGTKQKACTHWVSVKDNQMKRRTSTTFCGHKVNILSSFLLYTDRHLLSLLIWDAMAFDRNSRSRNPPIAG